MIVNKESNFISVVIYIHNGENKLEEFLFKVWKTIDENFKNFEIICVNDSSIDDSKKIVRDVASRVGSGIFSVVNMSIHQGVELSMNAGVDLAIGDYVIEFNKIDMDYDVSLIMQAYRRMLDGNDIVMVSPEKAKGFLSQLFYAIYNRYSNSQYKIRRDSFTIVSRRAINRIKSISQRIPYRKAMYVSCGLKIDTIVYTQSHYCKEEANRGTYSIKEKIAFDSLILFTNVAYKVSLFITMLLLLSSIVTAVYTVSIFLSKNKPVSGWTTIMLFLSFGFFGVFMMMAVLVKYLSVLVDLIFVKQRYLIESVEKISR